MTHHDPLFSRKYKTEELFQHLNEQKHFVLQIYHNQPPSVESIKTLGRFQGYIVSINSQLAVAFLGARLKFSAPITSGFVWSDESTKRICEGLIDQIVEDKDKIEKFENSGTANSLPLLIQQERVYDRAIIHWKDMDSHALLQYLKQEELKETGYETEFESASLTRWGGFKSNDWLIQQGFKNDDLRGTLIIDVQQISESLSDKICQARQYILELQGEE